MPLKYIRLTRGPKSELSVRCSLTTLGRPGLSSHWFSFRHETAQNQNEFWLGGQTEVPFNICHPESIRQVVVSLVAPHANREYGCGPARFTFSSERELWDRVEFSPERAAMGFSKCQNAIVDDGPSVNPRPQAFGELPSFHSSHVAVGCRIFCNPIVSSEPKADIPAHGEPSLGRGKGQTSNREAIPSCNVGNAELRTWKP